MASWTSSPIFKDGPSREAVLSMVEALRREHRGKNLLRFYRSPETTMGGVLLRFECQTLDPLADSLEPTERIAFFCMGPVPGTTDVIVWQLKWEQEV